MPQSRRRVALVPAPSDRSATEYLTVSTRALVAPLAILALVTSTAGAQGQAASDTPLHLPVSHFAFVASGDTQPLEKPLAVHNGGTARFTNVRVTRLAYADSARGASWLVALPRQTAV